MEKMNPLHLQYLLANPEEQSFIEAMYEEILEKEELLFQLQCEREHLEREATAQLEENVMYAPATSDKVIRSSRNIALDLEDTEHPLMTDETPQRHHDKAMQARVDYLSHTAGRTDVAHAKDYLVETWKLSDSR